MADPPGDDTGMGPGKGSPVRTPRWVKLLAIIGAVLALLVVILMFSGHGPGRHVSQGIDGRTPLPGIADHTTGD